MPIKKIFSQFKNEITYKEYTKYIKNLQLDEKSSNKEKITFIASNPLMAKWIKTKYSKKISLFFEQKTGIKPSVAIEFKKIKEIPKKEPKQKDEQNNKSTKTTNQHNNQNQFMILNPTYTFESFIVGSSNQMAYALCESISENPAKKYNPLFIYGMSGLGKTHLLQAIGNKAIKNNKKIIYTTSEQFTNDFTNSLRNKTPEKFREKYRNCDYLLIDDIQFLSEKEQTQEEFFHTFNELHSHNKQIVLTSDKPPKQIAGLEERLRSRFEWGMLTKILPPGLETKISIIEKKCDLHQIKLSKEIIHYIAAHMGENIREIESAITSIHSYSQLMNQQISIDFVRKILKDQIKIQQENITIDKIINIISKELNIKPSDIKSKKRNKNIVEARRISIFLARKLSKHSTQYLSKYFNMKDHTAISHSVKKINQLIEEDQNVKVKIEELKNKILTS